MDRAFGQAAASSQRCAYGRARRSARLGQGLRLRRSEREEGGDAATLYRIGSITKTFTALAILQLHEDSPGLQRDLPGTWWSGPSFPAQIADHFSATYPSSTQWEYSNVGYALLGEVIAAVGGDPWARHIERRILGPLGMTSTEAMPHRDEARLATGYSRPAPGEPHMPALRADHGAIGPAGGMA